MKYGNTRSNLVALVLVVLAVLNVAIALRLNTMPGNTKRAAERVSSILEDRLDRLEHYCSSIPQHLPEDMVIYVYRSDTLVEWHNQFMVYNDRLSRRVQLHTIINPYSPIRSPLEDISEELQFLNFGNKYYLTKRMILDDKLILMGLEIMDLSAKAEGRNGINPQLKLRSNGFSASFLSTTGGSAVCIDGKPLFKITFDSINGGVRVNFMWIWIALMLVTAASFFALRAKPTLSRLSWVLPCFLGYVCFMYFWGRILRDYVPVFSPTLYSGGGFLFSLGAVFIVNLSIVFIVGMLIMVREDLFRKIRSRRASLISLITAIAAIALILLYSWLSFSSIVLNSSITLELYRFGGLSVWSAFIYLSYIGMLISIPMIIYLANGALSRLYGFHINVFSPWGSLIVAALTSIFIVVLAASQGFHKEARRASVWANRIAVDRDIALEMDLCRAEPSIESDPLIGPLASLNSSAGVVRGRIVDNHLRRLGQNYEIVVQVFDNIQHSPLQMDLLHDRMSEGVPIADGSHFVFHDAPNGHIRYSGVFYYYVHSIGMVAVLIEVEPRVAMGMLSRNIWEDMKPGSVSVPDFYSYARYRGHDLQLTRGRFAYPTRLSDERYEAYLEQEMIQRKEGFVHFSYPVSDNEVVVFSRPKMGFFGYLIAVIFCTIFSFFCNRILCSHLSKRKRRYGPKYFRTRIIWILEMALVLVLLVMAAVSVQFVIKLNNNTLMSIMTDKINTVQSLVQNQLREIDGERELRSSQVSAVLNTIASNSRLDISLYSVDGRALVSTMPELYTRMMLGGRINENAYAQIVGNKKSYYIQREKIAGRMVYCMYAPIVNDKSRCIAILQCPYSGLETYDFERDATLHVVTLLSIFFIMLLLSRLLAVSIVDKIFKPLSTISRKMRNVGIEQMDYIQYDQKDEVSVLVDAYNKMVGKLSESTKQLALAERDKAWSAMARQASHEIKNPLTPIKLKLQRLIRLKAQNSENFAKVFDESVTVILSHIDMLADIASEFSSFANLYVEPYVEINLDSLIKQEIFMYEGQDRVKIEYMGLDDATIMGPKPQLTRVFINLLANAVQALDGKEGGRILVSLRKSSDDSHYDILFEDNGPGVSEDNLEKLFTPNFTTKSGGTGLGLAISRVVLERADASISYSKSFSLGGACFKIHYPKK